MNEGFCGEVSFSSVPVCCVGNWACRLRLAEDYGYSIVMVRFSIGVRLCHCFPVTQQYSRLFNRMSIYYASAADLMCHQLNSLFVNAAYVCAWV